MNEFRLFGYSTIVIALMTGCLFSSRECPADNTANLGSSDLCVRYTGLPKYWGVAHEAGMVRVNAGEFILGTNLGYVEERPEIKAKVKSFWIDQTEVTVAQFADFVKATGYVTEAEQEGGGVIFRIPSKEELKRILYPWWHYVKGANWKHPVGADSNADPNHPVTLVTLADAQAYANWLGRDLPTELEWEYAAKAGIQDVDMEKEPRNSLGKPQANFWQGSFPFNNSHEDGYEGVSPVGCYASNGFHLYDMIGNVWEQTKDAYIPSHQQQENKTAMPSSTKPNRAMVIKGGSHLCAQDYCVRYRPSAREAHEANLPIGHIGFRTVIRDTELN
jgi:formylglycine-generating enzyme required for sulfatase activity